jgi:expansin (peptidoglycan-binding protein)
MHLSLSLLLFILVTLGVQGATSPMSNCSLGRITYYTYTNNGQCSFGAMGGPTLNYPYIVAPNEAFYGDGSKCGVCYELTGPSGSVVVQVADVCPQAGNGACAGDVDHFDLGPNSATFGQVAPTVWGMTMISKRQVACPVTGNVGVRTKDGVNGWWMALLVFNHRVGVSAVQIQIGGVYQNMTRQIYNYWTYSGAIPQPFNIKIYSVLNDVISMTIPTVAAEQVYTSSAQFSVPPAGYGGSASGTTPCAEPATSPIIYDDALFKGLAASISWRDVSYGTASKDWAYSVNPKIGTKCLRVSLNAYGAVQLLRTAPFNITGVALSFWGRVETGTFTKWKVIAEGGSSTSVTLTTTWAQFTLPLGSSGLNAPNPFGGDNHKFQFQNNQNAPSPIIYMDDIKLVPV